MSVELRALIRRMSNENPLRARHASTANCWKWIEVDQLSVAAVHGPAPWLEAVGMAHVSA